MDWYIQQMDESQMFYTKWKKLESKGWVVYDSIHLYYILEKAKQISSCAVLRVGEDLTLKE